ncbi:TetR/AcrR family transcriptional regulator [Microbispora triticiradicis]|uniref:TetR/AcrR family transcriptional regulator n=2 Tax=Microbispora TaxID=2005 RepID=A0ABY3M334_9ACTN|nr:MULTISPECIES: TetR/AcrR family transcriptional regulator [Microbispora]TLP54001.1 TetR/AcrR family transcriptional regulator [Microbispora fusca]TYB65145.1 TetR/AcrR family transcriptional regulator [Microbispora tritici]
MTVSLRRQRVRDATLRELISVSRGILTDQGAEALTIRAVAREMGMTPPGVYRYFDSHRTLLDAVVVAVLEELTEHIVSAVDHVDAADTAGRLIAASRALRNWAVGHGAEFHLSWFVSSPDEGASVGRARRQVGRLFADVFSGVWRDYGPAPLPPEQLSPATERPARRLLEQLETELPSPSAAVAFTRCWLRLYGMVSVESLGLTRAIGDDAGELFEAELADLARTLGLPATALGTGR